MSHNATTKPPRRFTCSFMGCGRPYARDHGGCNTCQRYLCYKHVSPAFHRCPHRRELDEATWQAQIDGELGRLRARINEAAVRELVSELSGGKKCSVEQTNMMGFCNYHLRIRFYDGSPSWLLRVPRVTSCESLPEELAEYVIASEYATLKFLEKTAVPAPRAFGYGICSDGSDRGVGVSFLLCELLPGKPYYYSGVPRPGDDHGRRAKVLGGVADILAELAKHPFPKAGSLCLDGSGNIQVGPAASDRFDVLDPEGPFETPIDYYTAWAEQYLALIADRQLYTAYPVDAYLVHRFLKENAWQLAQKDADATAPTPPGEGFYLKHADDIGSHLLVDDDGKVTGIIDWQFSRVAPRSEAFGPSLVTADVQALGTGEVGLSADDVALAALLRKKGHEGVARWMSDKNEKARRFFWGLETKSKWNGDAQNEAKAILKAFGVQQSWEEWRETALREWAADERLQTLLKTCGPKREFLPRECKVGKSGESE